LLAGVAGVFRSAASALGSRDRVTSAVDIALVPVAGTRVTRGGAVKKRSDVAGYRIRFESNRRGCVRGGTRRASGREVTNAGGPRSGPCACAGCGQQ
jgi:hypothetical protein